MSEHTAEKGAPLSHDEHRRWMEIAEQDGWDGVRVDSLWHRAVEGVAWDLIEQTMDTADRDPSVEVMRAAYATARSLLASLRATPPASSDAGGAS